MWSPAALIAFSFYTFNHVYFICVCVCVCVCVCADFGYFQGHISDSRSVRFSTAGSTGDKQRTSGGKAADFWVGGYECVSLQEVNVHVIKKNKKKTSKLVCLNCLPAASTSVQDQNDLQITEVH